MKDTIKETVKAANELSGIARSHAELKAIERRRERLMRRAALVAMGLLVGVMIGLVIVMYQGIL